MTCGSCDRSWKMTGNWSALAREAVESRPCPSCGAYTLNCPEPEPLKARGRRYPWTLIASVEPARVSG
ncbi:hypothetical protein FRUB_01091 [Fimbriiglobus ruber]|uniref:Uncharacterized protein n=1 Tax=Fimbriiglobus ruber TaxID=1908690 RepID=A0A225E1C4_9BACT|nr:hypothetical protein FRUB_01091 [Fimbriiglobus ruber]